MGVFVVLNGLQTKADYRLPERQGWLGLGPINVGGNRGCCDYHQDAIKNGTCNVKICSKLEQHHITGQLSHTH
jgi:hypothetical protein